MTDICAVCGELYGLDGMLRKVTCRCEKYSIKEFIKRKFLMNEETNWTDRIEAARKLSEHVWLPFKEYPLGFCCCGFFGAPNDGRTYSDWLKHSKVDGSRAILEYSKEGRIRRKKTGGL